MSPRRKETRARTLKINSRAVDFRVLPCGADGAALGCRTGRLGAQKRGEVALIRCRGKYDAEGGFLKEIVQAQRTGCCGAVVINYHAGPELDHLSSSRLSNFGSEHQLSIPVVSIGLTNSLPFLHDEAVSVELHYSCRQSGNIPTHKIVAHLKKQRNMRGRARVQLRAKRAPQLVVRNTQFCQSMEHFGSRSRPTAELADKARNNEAEVDSSTPQLQHTAAKQESSLMLDGVVVPFQIAPFSASAVTIQATSAFGTEGTDLQGKIAVLRRRGKYDTAFIKDIAEAQCAGAAAAIVVMPGNSALELESTAVKAASLLRITIPVVLLALNHGYQLCRGNHSVPVKLTLRRVAAAQPTAAGPCKERDFDTPPDNSTVKPAKKTILNPMLLEPEGGQVAPQAPEARRTRTGPILNPMQLVLISDHDDSGGGSGGGDTSVPDELPGDDEDTLSSDDGEDALSDTSDDDNGVDDL